MRAVIKSEFVKEVQNLWTLDEGINKWLATLGNRLRDVKIADVVDNRAPLTPGELSLAPITRTVTVLYDEEENQGR